LDVLKYLREEKAMKTTVKYCYDCKHSGNLVTTLPCKECVKTSGWSKFERRDLNKASKNKPFTFEQMETLRAAKEILVIQFIKEQKGIYRQAWNLLDKILLGNVE
jgi:hypothetical protein